MVFITRNKPRPTSWKKNTSISSHLLVMLSQQSPLPPLRPTPKVSLNGPNTAYVLLVTLTPQTGHVTRYLLQSFPSLHYAYSSSSLFIKDPKITQEILNRHFVKHISLMARHMCYTPLNIFPDSPPKMYLHIIIPCIA